MRFFHPALSSVVLAKLTAPFVFPIIDKSVQEISLSSDLSILQVRACPRKTDIEKIIFALKRSVEELPGEVKLLENKSVFQVAGLCDVGIELSKTASQIRSLDPSFFVELAIYEESLKSDVEDNPLSLGDFVKSPLHMYYFQLQSLRREGVQHTIEFPLQSLAKNELLSQNDLNQIVTKLWLRTSAIRKEQAAALAKLPTTTDAVPYVFRIR